MYSFQGISPLWPPLPGKAVKLFFPTSLKTVSEISFGVGVQRPDLASAEGCYSAYHSAQTNKRNPKSISRKHPCHPVENAMKLSCEVAVI